jgi:hypothetical protein
MDGIEYSQQKNKSQKVMMQVKSRDGIGEGNERKQLTIYATLVQAKNVFYYSLVQKKEKRKQSKFRAVPLYLVTTTFFYG